MRYLEKEATIVIGRTSISPICKAIWLNMACLRGAPCSEACEPWLIGTVWYCTSGWLEQRSGLSALPIISQRRHVLSSVRAALPKVIRQIWSATFHPLSRHVTVSSHGAEP